MLKCRVFGGETGPFPMAWVFRVIRPDATVRFGVEPEPEATWELGPVANTSHTKGRRSGIGPRSQEARNRQDSKA